MMIRTYKNGQEKEWSAQQWAILGSDKYGWEIVPEVPKEILGKVEAPAQAAQAVPALPTAKRKKKAK